jgi:putative transposase
MLKTYKYRLYPTRKQTEKLEWTLETCRVLYNSCLVDRNRHYEQMGKGLSRINQQKILVRDKKNIEYLANIHSQVLQDVLFRVEKAYKAFFRRLKERNGKAGYPRFKNPGRYDSITYTQSGFSIVGGKLKLSKIGHIKLKLHRSINGIIKTCNIKREIDKWYVCFSVEYTPVTKKQTVIRKHVGIDVGIKSFAALSNGKTIDNPKHLVSAEEKLIRKQRRLSSKKKGSNNRKKAIISVAKQHKKVSNQRKDFQHKLSREIVSNYDAVGVEDLRIKNMVKNHNLAKSISDAGWGQFLSFMEYKAEEAGILFMRVNPRNTSKTCSVCGYIHDDMDLSVREWICSGCNTVHERDINAAAEIDNILVRKIRQELPEYTLGETGNVDDPISSNAYALKSTPSKNQEASPVRAG